MADVNGSVKTLSTTGEMDVTTFQNQQVSDGFTHVLPTTGEVTVISQRNGQQPFFLSELDEKVPFNPVRASPNSSCTQVTILWPHEVREDAIIKTAGRYLFTSPGHPSISVGSVTWISSTQLQLNPNTHLIFGVTYSLVINALTATDLHGFRNSLLGVSVDTTEPLDEANHFNAGVN